MNTEIENVLLVIIDALRTDRVGAYSDTNLTPNIDVLAKEGEVFERCYSCINTTDPSLTTIKTGRYPTRHGLINHGKRITEEERRFISGTRSIAELVNDTHTTIAIDQLGRWHQRGFAKYIQIDQSSRRNQRRGQKILTNFLYQIPFTNLVHYLPNKFEQQILSIYRKMTGLGGNPNPEGSAVTDKTINAIEQIGEDEPWFVLTHYWDTHIPYHSEENRPNIVEERAYKDGDVPLSEIFDIIGGSDWGERLKNDLLGVAETVGDVKRQYDAAAHRTDSEVGRLLDYLKSNNKLENTAIIVTADHGESLTGHNIFFDHHGLYDSSLHTPLLIKGPEFSGRETQFVQHFDLAPTIMELMGKQFDEVWFDGVSLVPPSSGQRQLGRDAVYAEEAHTARRRCIRTDSYKYIERLGEGDSCRYCDIRHASGNELYDLSSNPTETDNVLKRSPEVATQLAESLDTWINKLPAPSEGTVNFEEDTEVMERLEEMGYV